MATVTTTTAPVLRTVGAKVFAGSRDLAEAFGKRHDNVLRDIDALISEAPACALNFEETSRNISMPQGGTRQVRFFDMDGDVFALLAMGFTGAEAAV